MTIQGLISMKDGDEGLQDVKGGSDDEIWKRPSGLLQLLGNLQRRSK
jgi:hypothetical protein